MEVIKFMMNSPNHLLSLPAKEHLQPRGCPKIMFTHVFVDFCELPPAIRVLSYELAFLKIDSSELNSPYKKCIFPISNSEYRERLTPSPLTKFV